jgi:hypothetical protein
MSLRPDRDRPSGVIGAAIPVYNSRLILEGCIASPDAAAGRGSLPPRGIDPAERRELTGGARRRAGLSAPVHRRGAGWMRASSAGG